MKLFRISLSFLFILLLTLSSEFAQSATSKTQKARSSSSKSQSSSSKSTTAAKSSSGGQAKSGSRNLSQAPLTAMKSTKNTKTPNSASRKQSGQGRVKKQSGSKQATKTSAKTPAVTPSAPSSGSPFLDVGLRPRLGFFQTNTGSFGFSYGGDLAALYIFPPLADTLRLRAGLSVGYYYTKMSFSLNQVFLGQLVGQVEWRPFSAELAGLGFIGELNLGGGASITDISSTKVTTKGSLVPVVSGIGWLGASYNFTEQFYVNVLGGYYLTYGINDQQISYTPQAGLTVGYRF